MIGKQLGSYRIVEKIGEGGMGVVYRAEDVLLKRTVAIKVMNPEEAEQPDFKKRFLREAQVASSLNHPNIAQIFQLLEESGVHFIVMEYVNGTSLHALLRARGALPSLQAVGIARQIAAALDAAHTQGLIHRDIKPANIALDASGTAKLLDFGLAKWRKPPKDRDAYQTSTGTTVMGTVDYMSPEMALQEDVDGRSDLFSLGIVLYQMLTGELPFLGSNNIEVLFNITRPEKVQLDTTGLPRDLVTIIERLLEKDAADRYQTAAELSRDLDAVDRSLLTGRTVIRRRRLRRRHLLASAAASVVVLAVLAPLALYMRHRSSLPAAPAVAETTGPPAVTILPLVNRTGDAAITTLMLPLTHLLIACLRPLRSIDVLDYDRMIVVPGIADAAASEPPDPVLYTRLRSIRGTTAVVRPLLLKTGAYWQAIVEFRDPTTARLTDSRTCRQECGTDPEGSLGLLLDKIGSEIVEKLAGAGAEKLAAPVPLPPGRLESQRHFAAGVELSARQEHVKARSEFSKALSADPKDAVTLLRLAEEARELGNDEEAVRYAREASSLINESMNIGEGFEIEAMLHDVTHQCDRALEVLQKLAGIYPRRPEYRHRMGEIEHSAGRYKKAEEAWRWAVRLSPRYTPSILSMGRMCAEQTRYAESTEWYRKAEQIFESSGNEEGRAAVLCGLGDLDYRQNRIVDGRKKYEEALAIYRKENHQYGIAACTSAMGAAAQKMGDLDQSGRMFATATSMMDQLGNKRALVELYLQRAQLLISSGDYRGAIAISRQSNEVAEGLESQYWRARCQSLAGKSLLYICAYGEAEPLLASAIRAFSQTSSKREEGYTIQPLAAMLCGVGRFDECLSWTDRGAQVAGQTGDSNLAQAFKSLRAEIDQFRCDYAAALQKRTEMLDIAEREGDRDNVAYHAFNAARARIGLGDFAKAMQLLETADAYFQEIRNPRMHSLALLARIEVLRESGEADKRRSAELAADIFESLKNNAVPAYRLLGEACRSLYGGSAENKLTAIREVDAFLGRETVDLLIRIELEKILGELCVEMGDSRTGCAIASRMCESSRKLHMIEHGCRGCLLTLKMPAGGGSSTSRKAVLEEGRLWYRQLVAKIPDSYRTSFGARRSIAEMQRWFEIGTHDLDQASKDR